MANEYYIDFDTKTNPTKLGAVKVTIEYVEIEDLNKELAVDLCNHPLYPELKKYVLANK